MRRSTMKNEQMALLFSEATPYIQKYHGKTLVIKPPPRPGAAI